MKVSDHPAARSRASFDRQSVDQAAEEDEPVTTDEHRQSLADHPSPEMDGPLGPTRDPIVTAPRDGRDVRVYWGTEDETGRLARWHEGRRFNGRRWVIGGSWIPADGLALGMIPLPAAEPTEWLHDWSNEPQPNAEDEAEQAVA